MVYGCLYCARSYEKTLSTLSFAGYFCLHVKSILWMNVKQLAALRIYVLPLSVILNFVLILVIIMSVISLTRVEHDIS